MSLNTAAGPNGLLVVFSCNTCPFVVGNGEKVTAGKVATTRPPLRQRKRRFHGFGHSNEAKRDNHDSMDAMKAHAKETTTACPTCSTPTTSWPMHSAR